MEEWVRDKIRGWRCVCEEADFNEATGDEMHRCILPKRSKQCPDTTLDPPQGLAATKYISLYIPCRLRTAGRGV